ncbi:hypothetical protein [Dysgonomonas sp. Marseille-P4677]|nr:hypothetical protein [Dysgonomonas sp. Marseille-P4677]
MTQSEAQSLLDILYSEKSTPEEKELAYRRLSEMISVLLPD